MVARVWDQAMASGATEVVVATDDERIVREIESQGGKALMTSPTHRSGTDRLAEVASTLGWSDETIVVNLQGDEPCIPVELLSEVASALNDNADAAIATMATPIHSSEELFNENAVKVVLDESGMALYFSRAPIPWHRGIFSMGAAQGALPAGTRFLRHIGMYAYRASALRNIAAPPPDALEEAESLEQLRALAMGLRIHVSVVAEPPPPGVDTASDLERARRVFEGE